MLKVNDIIVSKVNCGALTFGKEYIIIHTRNYRTNDICIVDDEENDWWFGQIGETEEYTRWFMDKKGWDRMKKIDDIIN
jgi:hypothetical protein